MHDVAFYHAVFSVLVKFANASEMDRARFVEDFSTTYNCREYRVVNTEVIFKRAKHTFEVWTAYSGHTFLDKTLEIVKILEKEFKPKTGSELSEIFQKDPSMGDHEFIEYPITKVVKSIGTNSVNWFCYINENQGIGIPDERGVDVEPKPGETLRVFHQNPYETARGASINGRLYFYHSQKV
jgi:hypothetical protein